MRDITSIFRVTDLKTDNTYREAIIGDGQEAVIAVRKLYPRLSRFILEGFEVDGTFVELDTK